MKLILKKILKSFVESKAVDKKIALDRAVRTEVRSRSLVLKNDVLTPYCELSFN